MNKCMDIEKRLPAYLEGDVALQEQRLIEEHLAACKQCKKVLEDIKMTTDIVRNLEDVEPPPWFKQKIMARVREEAEKSTGILRKLFFPLHIKIPVEVFATCLVVVMALYVFKTTSPEINSLQAPSEKTQTVDSANQSFEKTAPAAPVSNGKIIREKQYKKDNVTASQIQKGGTGAIPSGEALPAPNLPAMPTPAPLAVSDSVGTAPAGAAKEQGIEGKRETFQPAPSAAGAPVPVHKKKGDVATSDTRMQYRLGRETASVEPQLKASVAKKPQSLNITIKADDISAAGRTIEGFFNQSGVVDFKQESSGGIKIITATLPVQILKEFFEKLKTVGEVRENILSYNAPEGNISVRIEIVSSW